MVWTSAVGSKMRIAASMASSSWTSFRRACWLCSIWPAISARFARLARDGEIELDDPDLAARQFMALISADLPDSPAPEDTPTPAEVHRAASNAVRTFLRAFPPRAARRGKPTPTARRLRTGATT